MLPATPRHLPALQVLRTGGWPSGVPAHRRRVLPGTSVPSGGPGILRQRHSPLQPRHGRHGDRAAANHMKALDIRQDALQKIDLYHDQTVKKAQGEGLHQAEGDGRGVHGPGSRPAQRLLARNIRLRILRVPRPAVRRELFKRQTQGRRRPDRTGIHPLSGALYALLQLHRGKRRGRGRIRASERALKGRRGAGDALASTPVADLTPIDEALANGGRAVEEFQGVHQLPPAREAARR